MINHGTEDDVESNIPAVQEKVDLEGDLKVGTSANSAISRGSLGGLEVGGDSGKIVVNYYVSGTSEVRKYYTLKFPNKNTATAEKIDDKDSGVNSKKETVEGSAEDEDDEDEDDNESLHASGGVLLLPGSKEDANFGCHVPRVNAVARKMATSGIEAGCGSYNDQKTYTPLQRWEYENGLDVDGVTDVKRWAIEVGLADEGDDDTQKAKRLKRSSVIEPPKYGYSTARIMITSAPDTTDPEEEKEEPKPDDDDDGTRAQKGKKKL